MSLSWESSDDPKLHDALEEYAAALAAGRPVSRERLLAAHPAETTRLAAALDALDQLHAAAPAGRPLSEAATDADDFTPVILDEFQIVRELGRGGMGVVYEARERALDRRVALKILPFAAALDPRSLARFRQESLAAAQLDHPHIVRVYAVGVSRGVHYYAMQYIEGPSLAQVVAQMRSQRAGPAPGQAPRASETAAGCAADLSTERATNPREYYRAVARLGVQVAQALDYAHSHGILHRDVKPGNLLLDERGLVWVTDFGLARIDNDVNLTLSGDVLGTLRYMSPEQSRARRGLVDQRTDIYSLGATLYEMLTLEPAFPTEDRGDLLRQIAYEEPRPLRQIDRTIPGELETIVLKALEKDPADRYATSLDLALDLRRFLDDQPLAARRATSLERVVKWSRRHRSLVASLAVSLFISLAGLAIVAVIYGWNQRQVANDRAGLIHRGLLDNAEALRTARAASYRDQVWTKLKAARALDVRDHELERVKSVALACLGDPFGIGTDPGIEVKRRPPRQVPRQIRFRDQVIDMAAISPQPTYAVSDDGMWAVVGRELELLDNEGLWHAIPLRLGHVHGMEFSPSGRFLAAACEEGAIVWTVPELAPELVVRGDVVRSVVFHPTGQLVALLNRELRLELWSLASHRLVHSLNVPAETRTIEFSLDGDYLLALAGEKTAAAYSITTTPEKRYLLGHTGAATAVDFSPDGELVASVSKDRTVRLWEAANGRMRHTLPGHQSEIQDAAFSPDGKWLATGDWGGTIFIWDVKAGTRAARIESSDATGQIWRLRFDPQGRYLAAAGGGVRPGATEMSLRAAQGYYLNTAASGGVGAWSIDESTGNPTPIRLFTVRHRQQSTLYDLAIHPDGRQIAFLDTAGQCWTWQVGSTDAPRALPFRSRLDFPSLTFDAAGMGLSYVTPEQAVAVWDWTRQASGPVTTRRFTGGTMARLARTRDGGRVAVVAPANQIVIYDLAADREIAQLPRERAEVWTLNWSQDGVRLVIGLADGTVAIWDLEKVRASLNELGIELPPMAIGHAPWSPDAVGAVATLSRDELARLRDTALREQLHVLRVQTEWGVRGGQFLAVDAVTSKAVRLAQSGHIYSDDSRLEFVRTLNDLGFQLGKARFCPSAERMFGAAIAAFPADGAGSSASVRTQHARNDWGLGRCRELQGHWLDAAALYRRAAEILAGTGAERHPERTTSEMQLAIALDHGRVLAAHHLVDEAEQVVRQAVESWDSLLGDDSSRVPDARIRAGSLLAEFRGRPGRVDMARADLRKVLRLRPDDATACNALAWLMVSRPGQASPGLDEAVALAQKAVDSAPGIGAHWNTLGAARFRARDWQAAVQALKESRGLNRARNFAHDGFLLAMCQWHLGNRDGARLWHIASCHWMGRFAAHDEELADFRRESSSLLEDPGPETGILTDDNAEADVLLYSRIIEADPEAGWAFLERARCAIEKGDQSQAALDLSRAAELPGTTPGDWQALASGFRRIERWSDAIAAQEKLLEMVPGNESALNDLAWVLATCPQMELQDARRAVELASRATGRNPFNGMYWNTLGVAQYRLGNWTAARTALDYSLSALHETSFAHNAYFMALVVDRLGERSLAEKWFAAAAAWSSRFSAGDEELSRFAREAAQALALPEPSVPRDAADVASEPEVYTSVAAALPGAAWVLTRRTECHAARGDRPAALADLSAALDLVAYDQMGRLEVVQIADRLGDWKLVVRAASASSAERSEIELLAPYRARAWAELGQWESALRELVDMIEFTPDNRDLSICQAIVNLEAGNLGACKRGCQTLVDQIAASPLPSDAAPLVSTLLAVRPDDLDVLRLTALSEKSASRSPESARVLGAALCRSGKFIEAVKTFEDAKGPPFSARDHFFLALAHHGLDQGELACEHFAQGVEVLAAKSPAADADSGPGPLVEWFTRVADEHLRREVESVVAHEDSP